MTGLKRVDAPTRAAAPVVGFDTVVRRGQGQPDGHVDRRRRRPLRGRPPPAGAPAAPRRATCPSAAPRPPAGGRRARTPGPAAGRAPARSSAGCTADMPRDLDNPYGMEFRGRERALRFVRPYRHIGELSPAEQTEAGPPPLRGGPGHHRALLERGGGRPRRGARRGRAAEVGRPLPPAPGRRRLHDAHQGAGRGAHRAPGPGDRPSRRGLRRGARRQPGLRQPLRRHHDPPDHPAALAAHRGHPPDVAALLGRRPDHGPGVRRLGPQRLLVPGGRRGRRRGGGRPAGGPGHLGLLHRQPGVRQSAPQVQDRRDRLPRGLRPGGDRRHRAVAGPGRRRHRRLQRAGRRRAVRRRADGVRTSTCSSSPTRRSS